MKFQQTKTTKLGEILHATKGTLSTTIDSIMTEPEHKRLIDILDPPSTTVDALMQLDLPSGVNIEIKLN